MKTSVNKSIQNLISKKVKQYKLIMKTGISIITCTNKSYSLNNILNNFNRQDYEKKELIIVINKNSIDENQWKEKIAKYNNIKILKLDEKISLGECLNFGVSSSKYDIIAKFDDDDYYGPKYLLDSVKYFYHTNASLIGKNTIFVYFIKNKTLAIKDQGLENQYVYFLNGATLMFKKEIFNKVSFRNVSVSEDVFFCNDCISNGIKLYSGNKYHFAYLRYPSKENHTWKIDNENLMNLYCSHIKQVDDFKEYVNI